MSSTALILFGATGDLAREKLFPALASLKERGKLPGGLKVVAIGRRDYSRGEFVEHISRKREYPPEFIGAVEYFKMDFLSPEGYGDLVAYLRPFSRRLFYLAVPPDTYEPILSNIASSGAYQCEKDGWSRLALEKPFGSDEESAKALNGLVCSLFHEENTYRIDHYLGKETVENILAFRFSNPLFESVWNAEHVDHIQITSAERHGLQGRTSFYSKVGATRDLIQNHLMQLVTLLTMEAPASLDFDALADAKMKVLRSLRADAARSVFGQYDADYVRDELGSAETYAMTTMEVDSERWKGVPMYVRTGKCLPERVTEISVYFKPGKHTLFEPDGGAGNNVVTFRIQPNEGIFVRFAVKRPGQRARMADAQMVFCYESISRSVLPDAYENLFEAVLEGQRSVALRSDVIEESWRVIDGLLAQRDSIPLEIYPVGSWGPKAADDILAGEGRKWEVADQSVCNGVTVLQ